MSIPAERIRARRLQVGLTQEELGARIGKDQKQIWRYETGRNDPTGEVLVDLARALETTADYLLGLFDTPDRPLNSEKDLNSEERELLQIYRSKTAAQRKQIVSIATVV